MLNTQNYRFYPLQKELHFRRLWLLWHNQKFRKEFEELRSQSGIKPWSTQPQWRSIMVFPDGRVRGSDYPPLHEFYARYGLGTNWPEYSVIKKFGERPFGIEIIGNPAQPECLKLVLWPNEINKKNVQELWPMVDKCKQEYFAARDVPWSLEFTNFWRDADWYNLYWSDTHWHDRRGKSIQDIAEGTEVYDPLTYNFLFLESLLKQQKEGEKSDLLSQLDPKFRIINSSRFTLYTKITRLLYTAGILIIGSTCSDWGDDFPYQDAWLLRINHDDENHQKGQFYIHFVKFVRNPQMFRAEATEIAQIKEKEVLRKTFLDELHQDYMGKNLQMELGRLIYRAIKRVEKRIDSVV